jgi:hypothetical protein
MGQIIFNTLSGTSPYDVYISDIYGNNNTFISTIVSATTITVPELFSMAPEIKLTIIDASGCTYSNILLCNELIPTPSVTPTVTPTISVTPTVTPTISVTPTVTPTISVTPTVTPTISVTPTVTPTITVTLTPTPSITPTSSPMALKAILFIEPLSGSSLIGQWMTDEGVDFYGFSNGSQPSMAPAYFNDDMNAYVNFSGWTNNVFPEIITSNVPQTTGGVDALGNPIVAYNFETVGVSIAESTSGNAWYTWIVPVSLTNNLTQLTIGYSTSSPSPLTIVSTESTIRTNTFTYTGNLIPKTTYRVYTTYPGTNFRLANTGVIYFKGESVG